MKKVFSAIVLLAIILVTPGLASAEDDKASIIEECEKIFPELEVLGKAKFDQRYLYFTNLQDCYTLYDDPIWYSNGQDRTQELIELLDKPVQETPVRDRFVQNNSIPQWIKDDATRWHQGKERDNIFSYGIRYMITSKILHTQISTFDPQNCTINAICISENDFLKYSIKDSQIGDVVTLTHTFGTSSDSITVSTAEVSRNGKTTDYLQIKSDGLIKSDQAKYYQFAHKIPMRLGTTINSVFDIKVTDEIVFPIKDKKRDAFLAWDDTKQYHEVIDKQTGIVLFIKQENRIKKSVWSAELIDTNVFTKEIKIQYDDMRIPPWFRTTVKWWTEEKISDVEYLDGISYLLKNNIMQI
ncbi:MAG: hypothetical protein ACT4NT_07675 [Nitrososphaerota archaeon]